MTIGWLSALLALGIFPVLFGPIAICMGIVLRRDYEVGKHGSVLIVVGIINVILGMLMGAFLL